MNAIANDYSTLLPPPLVKWLQRAKEVGFHRVLQEIRDGSTIGSSETTVNEIGFQFALGELLLARVPAEKRDAYIPFDDILVHLGQPHGNTILVEIRSLQRTATDGGTAYYSPYQPTLDVNGSERIVAFSNHAAERHSAERAVNDWRTYGGLGDVFAYFYNCVYFEPAKLHHGQEAISLYQNASPVSSAILTLKRSSASWTRSAILCTALDIARSRPPRFVVAKISDAGHERTPEYQRVLRPLIKSFDAERDFKSKVDDLVLARLSASRDFSLLKSFHTGGFPR